MERAPKRTFMLAGLCLGEAWCRPRVGRFHRDDLGVMPGSLTDTRGQPEPILW